MATTRIDNVRPEILRWATQRAGYVRYCDLNTVLKEMGIKI
jgi:hypothetical protein